MAAQVQWSSRFAFMMAAIGSAVGLGNLWRFPFQTGQNGGSAFVFIYILCVAFVAYPILMAELSIGRHKRLSAVGSTREIAREVGASSAWQMAGWTGIIAGFLVVSTYCVIAGQVMAYAAMSFLGEFAGRTGADAAEVASLYNGQVMALGWHGLFVVLTIAVVAAGVQGGIERICNVLMPLFFLMLAGLAAYALITGDREAALTYLFTPRFDEVTPSVFLAALGQAFFSIGVGAGILMTYGAFLSKDTDIANVSGVIAFADTAVAIVAGLMIFPIVFQYGLDPAAGSGLIFGALPAVFAGMPGGAIIGGLFFTLAFVAAITSSISLLMGVATVGAEQLKISRALAAIIFGVAAGGIGAFSILVPSWAPWIDFTSGSLLLPLGGLLIALFAGWVVPRAVLREEVANSGSLAFAYWRFFIRFAAPIAVFLILLLGVDAQFGFGLNAWIGSLGR